jgi:hypothetical protein
MNYPYAELCDIDSENNAPHHSPSASSAAEDALKI